MNYCVKCRQKTENVGENTVQSGNRVMIKSKCGTCGGKKSCFAKKEKGGSLTKAMAILEPLQGISGSFISDDFNAKIDRYLSGGAIQNEMFKKGLQLGTDKEFQSLLHGKGVIVGNGVGDEIKDFFNGVLLGFSNPMKGLKALGKAIGLGVKGKGQRKGSGIVFL